MKINTKCNTIKEKIKIDDAKEALINIKYPSFEAENGENSKICDKMNAFYRDIAKKYLFGAKKHIPGCFARTRYKDAVKASALMTYTVSLCDEKIICVVVDLSFCFGKSIKTRRFSQNWSVESGRIIETKNILKNNLDGRKKIYSLVLSVARKNKEEKSFGYFDDYEKRLKKAFDTESFFVSPRGICFFVNAGIISPVKHGASCFVLPYESIKDIISREFLPKECEKDFESSNIVNNI